MDAGRQYFHKGKATPFIVYADGSVTDLALTTIKQKKHTSQNHAMYETKISAGSINNVVRGRRQTAGGFIWRYAN